MIQGTRKANALAGLDVLAVRECGSASDHAHARTSHTVGAPALSGNLLELAEHPLGNLPFGLFFVDLSSKEGQLD